VRVLVVTDWTRVAGGTEVYAGLVCESLRRAGDEVRLLASTVGEGARVADYPARGSDRLAAQAVLQVANPFAARAARRALAELRPEVALVCMFEQHLSPSVVLALRGLPVVLSVGYYKPVCPTVHKLLPDGSLCGERRGAACVRHGCVTRARRLRELPRYARIEAAFDRAAAVLACSRWLAAELRRGGIAARPLPPPVAAPSAAFSRRLAAEPLFVYAGRLGREKGVDVLLRALARVRAGGLAARLRIVGDGPLRRPLEQLARSLGLEEAVAFRGHVPAPEVEAELRDAWALVAPSVWAEPFGLVAPEAIVRGVPVVASAAGGLAESVEHGVSGLLVRNGDEDGLAESLAAVASRRAFPGLAVPPAAVERLRRRHEPARHAAALRSLFADLTASGPESRAGGRVPRATRGSGP
jgi:glycosyltransferase involved in cell wall biosynthesis